MNHVPWTTAIAPSAIFIVQSGRWRKETSCCWWFTDLRARRFVLVLGEIRKVKSTSARRRGYLERGWTKQSRGPTLWHLPCWCTGMYCRLSCWIHSFVFAFWQIEAGLKTSWKLLYRIQLRHTMNDRCRKREEYNYELSFAFICLLLSSIHVFADGWLKDLIQKSTTNS